MLLFFINTFVFPEFAGEMARATNMSTEYLRRCLLPTGTEPVKGLPAVFYAGKYPCVVTLNPYSAEKSSHLFFMTKNNTSK